MALYKNAPDKIHYKSVKMQQNHAIHIGFERAEDKIAAFKICLLIHEKKSNFCLFLVLPTITETMK